MASKCLVVLAVIAILWVSPVIVDFLRDDVTASLGGRRVELFVPPPSGHTSSAAASPGGDRNLLFDPVLVYSTFLGGPNAAGNGVRLQGATLLFVDGSGNTYVAGTTNSPSFPVTPGVVQSSNPQAYSLGFLSKVDPTGQSLLFSTYIPATYSLTGLAVDPSGNIFVTGPAGSLPIPAGTSPFQSTPKSMSSIGILKLNSTATAVLNATYLDGSGTDAVRSIAVDSAGNLYVAGSTTSNDFPTTQNALQTTLGSAQNGFLTKLNPSLSALVYSTYLGQTSSVNVAVGPHSVAVDPSGNAYVTGYADSGFPTTSGAVQPNCPTNQFCAFLAKLNLAGSALTYSTFLAPPGGGSQGFTVAVDGSQNAYVGGDTPSGFPEVNSVQSCSSNGGFLSEIDASGALKFSTCLGTGGILDLAVDSSGNVYAVGNSDSSLPLKNPIQTSPAPVVFSPSSGPPFVASISPNTNPPALLFSSFIGGAQPNEVDIVASVGADSSGDIYAAGTAGAGGGAFGFSQAPAPFPVFDALQPIPAVGQICPGCASSNAFLMKVSPTNAPAAAFTPALLNFPPQQVGSSSAAEPVTVIDLGSASLTISNATVSGDFSIQDNCSTESPAGGTCTIQVTFTPTATGTRTGTLTITDNSAGSPRTVELTGQGAVTTATVAPSNLTFASQLVGTTSSAQTITVTNPGPLGLQISHVQGSGDFSETNNCGTSLGPTAGCAVNVTFTPTASGNRTGTLTIVDNASDSPQTIALTGTGSTGFAVTAGTASATVAAGATATFNLTATAASGFSGSVNFTCAGAPTASTCSVSPNPANVTGGTPAMVGVTVTTTARSTAQLGTGQSLTAMSHFGHLHVLLGSLIFGMFLLPAGLGAKKGSGTTVVLVGVVLISAALFGCGGGGRSTPPVTGTPSGTYILTVTGTSGTTTQSTSLTLTVQ